MHALDAGRLRIGQRGVQALLQIVEALGQRGKSLFAGIPVAGRQIEQRLGQAVALQPLADLFGRMIVGKQEFDRGEPRFRRRLKTVEERHFGEHHGEIGGKTGHRLSSWFAYFGSPGSFVPVTLAYIRATDASSSRPMPEADVIKNICSAAADDRHREVARCAPCPG